jgi:hypothetical protein
MVIFSLLSTSDLFFGVAILVLSPSGGHPAAICGWQRPEHPTGHCLAL